MPGRSMAGHESLKLAMGVRFAPRQPDLLVEFRGVVKATVTSLCRKTPCLNVSSSRCEVIQLVRITGSDPGSCTFESCPRSHLVRSQSLAERCLTVYQEGRVQLPLRPPMFVEASMV